MREREREREGGEGGWGSCSPLACLQRAARPRVTPLHPTHPPCLAALPRHQPQADLRTARVKREEGTGLGIQVKESGVAGQHGMRLHDLVDGAVAKAGGFRVGDVIVQIDASHVLGWDFTAMVSHLSTADDFTLTTVG